MFLLRGNTGRVLGTQSLILFTRYSCTPYVCYTALFASHISQWLVNRSNDPDRPSCIDPRRPQPLTSTPGRHHPALTSNRGRAHNLADVQCLQWPHPPLPRPTTVTHPPHVRPSSCTRCARLCASRRRPTAAHLPATSARSTSMMYAAAVCILWKSKPSSVPHVMPQWPRSSPPLRSSATVEPWASLSSPCP